MSNEDGEQQQNQMSQIISRSSQDGLEVAVPPINLTNVDTVSYLLSVFPFLAKVGRKEPQKM